MPGANFGPTTWKFEKKEFEDDRQISKRGNAPLGVCGPGISRRSNGSCCAARLDEPELRLQTRPSQRSQEARIAFRKSHLTADWGAELSESNWTKRANTIIAGAALLALIVNIWLVLTARQTEETQLRAYLIPSPPTLIKEPRNSKTGKTGLGIGLKFENMGQTPAYNLETMLAISIHDFPLTQEIKMEAPLVQRGVVGKVADYEKIQSKGFSDDEMKQITEPTNMSLYIRGHACYRSFRTRHLSFCFVYLGDKYKAFSPCGRSYDYEDDKCPRELFPPASTPPFVITREVSPSAVQFEELAPPALK
jgi:hypothetical protein